MTEEVATPPSYQPPQINPIPRTGMGGDPTGSMAVSSTAGSLPELPLLPLPGLLPA